MNTFIFGISLSFNVLLIVAIIRISIISLRKIELLEGVVTNLYQSVSITLHTMRALDEKQMFERDDEVGSVFSQLTDVINDLRPIIYGSANLEEEQ